MRGSFRFFSLFILVAVLSYGIGCATSNLQTPKASVKEEKKSEMIVPSIIEGYQDWPNTFSQVQLEKKEFHRVLVSPEAFETYKKGNGAYNEGDRLILEFSKLENKEKDIIKGEVTLITLMVRDSTAKNTGSWRFLAFNGDKTRKDMDTYKECYICHTGGKDNNYVFSKYTP